MTVLMRLYPQDWRERYEDEFLSLLAEREPSHRDRLDIVRGAVDARVHPQTRKGTPRPIPERRPPATSVRAIGLLTLAGGLVWLVGLVVAINGPIVADPGGSYRDGMAAVPLFMIAMTLLGVGLVQVARELPRGSDAGGMAAAAAAVSGWIWSAMPWMFPLLVIASVGWVGVAVSARRAGLWSTGDVVVLAAGQAVLWAGVAAGMLGIRLLPGAALDSYAIPMVALVTVWLAVGHALVVGHRSQADVGTPAGD